MFKALTNMPDTITRQCIGIVIPPQKCLFQKTSIRPSIGGESQQHKAIRPLRLDYKKYENETQIEDMAKN